MQPFATNHKLTSISNPETIIARQEAMIQAGTHAMIAEKLARDAVFHQDRTRVATKKPPVVVAVDPNV